MITENKTSNFFKGPFHLNKWFLDFVGNNGKTMIFYAAKLTWHNLIVPYTSLLHYDPDDGVWQKSRTVNVQLPEKRKNIITWNDSKFKVNGIWKTVAKPLQARLFDFEEGFLDWTCFQPASKVYLKIDDVLLEGEGYVEQLIINFPPWNIPMNELRWGRFISSENQLVWIEVREEADTRQWVWWNGNKMNKCTITDGCVSILEKDTILNLDQGVKLESDTKIYSVVKNLTKYIPGFNKVIPLNFLMAKELKWLSKCQLISDGKKIASGMAIHEMVNFKPQRT